ncbi:conjugative transposon protein TraM [Segetibacter koreensis]|uniref:conjugative transposon protein TraM n=1 Tax=Segetibacter koreensis TaxID=398037 RepID=UPI00037CEE3B|nr:conjugative transposon protein TraM [Segetibacter koreensis]
METETFSPQLLRKRKFLLGLPLLVLPFVTLLFWTLGGGKTNDGQREQAGSNQGLNTQLPDANLKDDKPLDKLSYYEKAESDSAKLKGLIKNDPYYSGEINSGRRGPLTNDSLSAIRYKPTFSYRSNKIDAYPYASTDQDSNEAKVYSKLEQLDKVMNQVSTKSIKKSRNYGNVERVPLPSMGSSEINRLEQMMTVNKPDTGNEDPEMKELNGVMEKILDIQHPERVNERIRQTSEANKGQIFEVNVNANNDFNSLLISDKAAYESRLTTNRFYALNEDVDTKLVVENAIKAVVYQQQVLVDGSIVKLRLLDEIFINGNLIPKNSFVFGMATLNGERLIVKITSIRYKNSLYPVELSVVDMDGIDGIYIPGAITHDFAKKATERTMQEMGITTLDPSFKAQAATAGLEAAKTLLNGKAKLIKVIVKAGYQVLLRDEKKASSQIFQSLSNNINYQP